MLDSIVTSKTRIQILLRFFLDGERTAYLRELSAELGESTNSVRVELNRLSKAKLIESFPDGRSKMYRANRNHPLFPEIQSIVKKTLGIDKVIQEIVCRLGDVEVALITGDYARGIDSGIIDLVLVGDIDRSYLDELIRKAEKYLSNRKIRCLCLTSEEFGHLLGRIKQEKGLLEIYRRDG
jgi:DNA-binding transcriptional ArsR family regulator